MLSRWRVIRRSRTERDWDAAAKLVVDNLLAEIGLPSFVRMMTPDGHRCVAVWYSSDVFRIGSFVIQRRRRVK